MKEEGWMKRKGRRNDRKGKIKEDRKRIVGWKGKGRNKSERRREDGKEKGGWKEREREEKDVWTGKRE